MLEQNGPAMEPGEGHSGNVGTKEWRDAKQAGQSVAGAFFSFCCPLQAAFDPSLSADGRYVAFYSHASDLVPGDTNRNTRDRR